VAPEAIVTSSFGAGTNPPTQVDELFQLPPVAVLDMLAADEAVANNMEKTIKISFIL
jgi:hypothetical protein